MPSTNVYAVFVDHGSHASEVLPSKPQALVFQPLCVLHDLNIVILTGSLRLAGDALEHLPKLYLAQRSLPRPHEAGLRPVSSKGQNMLLRENGGYRPSGKAFVARPALGKNLASADS